MTNPINGTGYDLGILYATRPRVPLPSSGSILFEADARIGDVQGVMDLEHLGKCEVSRTGREAVFNFTMSEEMKIKLTPWRQIPLRNLFIFLSASHKRLFAHLRGFPNPWDASIATFYPQARVARIDMKEFPLSYLVRGLKGKPTGEIKLKDVTIRSRFSFNTNTTAAKIAKVRDTKVVSKKDNNSTPRVKSVIRTTAKGRVDLSPMAYMFNSLKNFTDVRARFRATDKGIKLRAYLGHGIDLVPRLLELEDPEFHVTRRITNKTRTEVKLFGSVELLDTLSDVTILFKNFRSILKTNITFGENYSTKIVGASRYARKDSKEFQDDFQLRASFSKNFLEFLSNKIAKIVRRNVKRYHGVPTSKRYEKMLQKTDRALNRGRARLADLKKRLATGETARMQRLRLLIAKKKANIAKIQAKISFTQNHEQRHLKSNQAMLNGNMTRLQESIFKLKASREKALAELNRIMSQTTKTGSQNSDRIAKLHAKIAELKGQKTGKSGKNVPVSQAKIDKVKAKLAKLRASLAEKANNNKKPVQQTGAQKKLQDKINKIEAKLAKYRASNPSQALKALFKVIAALRKQGLGSQSKLRPARALALSKVQKIQAALIRLTAKTAQIPKLTNELVQLQKKNEQLKNEIYAAKNNKAGPQKTGEAQLLLVKLAESEALVTKINRAATKLEKVKAQISKITKAIGKLPAPKKPSKDTKISKDVLKSQIAGVNSELKTLKRKHNLSKSSNANVAEYDAKIKKVAEKIQALEKSSTTTINVSDLQKQLARLQHRKARTIKIRDQRAQLKNSIAKLKDLINKIKTGAAISDDHEKELLVADKIQAQTKLHKALLTLAKLPQMQSALAAMKSKPNPQNQKQIPKLEATISKVQKLASAEKPLREKIASLDKKIKKFQSSGVSKQQARLAATKSKLQVKLTIHNNAIAKKQRVEKELSKVRTRLGAYLNPNTLSSTHKSKLDKLRTALQQVEALRPKAQQLRTQIDQVNQQIIQASGKVSLNIFRKLAHASSNVVKQAQLAQLEAKYAKVKNIDQSIAKLNGEINVVKQKLEKSRKAKFFNIILKMKIPILTIKLRKLESRKAVEVAVKNSMGVIKAQIDKLRGELRTSQPNQAAAGNLPALKSEKSKLEAQLANVNKAISKIDKMKSEIAKVNVHVIAKVSVDAKHQRWKNVMLKLEEAVRRIANHEKNAHLIEKRIRAIDAELKLLANKKPKISDLMGKLSKLEQKLKDVEKEERGIDKLEKQIQNVQSAITNAKGAASVQVASKSQISTLKIRLNELYKRRAIVVDRKKHSRKHKEAKVKLMAKLRGLLSLLKKHLEKDLAKLQKLVGKLAATKKVVEETKQKLKQMGMNDQVKLVKLKQMLEVNKAAIRRKNTKLVRLGALKLKIEKLKAKVAKIQPKLESKRGVNPNVSKLNEKLAFEEKNAQKLKSKIAKMLKLKQQIKVLKTKLIASGGKPVTSVEAIKSKIAKLEAFLANPNRKSGRGGRTTTDAKQKIRALKAKIEKLSKAGTSDKVKALKRTIQKIDKQLMRKNARFVKTDSKMRTKPRFAIHDERAIHALQAAMTTIQAKVKKAEKKLQILMKHISKKMIVGGQALKDKLAKKLNAKIAKIERRIDRLQALKSKVLGKGVLDAAKMNHLVVTRIIGSTTLSELTRTGKFAQAQVFISIGKSQVRITTSLNPKYPGRFVRRVLRKAIRKILRSL